MTCQHRRAEVGMKKIFTLVLLGAVAAGCQATAQDAPSVIDAATRAMGTSNVQSIQYSGSGSVFMLGQNVRPEAAWPKFTVPKYTAAVRYDAPAFREELVRIDTEDPPRGGGAGGYSATTGQEIGRASCRERRTDMGTGE